MASNPKTNWKPRGKPPAADKQACPPKPKPKQTTPAFERNFSELKLGPSVNKHHSGVHHQKKTWNTSKDASFVAAPNARNVQNVVHHTTTYRNCQILQTASRGHSVAPQSPPARTVVVKGYGPASKPTVVINKKAPAKIVHLHIHNNIVVDKRS